MKISIIKITLMLGIFCSQLFWSQVVAKENTVEAWTKAKIFYLTYLLTENTNVNSIINSRLDVQNLSKVRLQSFKESTKCMDKDCFISAFKWTDTEIITLGNAVVDAFDKDRNIQNLMTKELFPSKVYGNPFTTTAKEYVRKALVQDLISMNYIIDIYGNGNKPNYPNIDSISFDVRDKQYPILLKGIHEEMMSNENTISQPLQITMYTALRLLEINDRMEAGQQQILQEKENEAAVNKVKSTDFSKFPYIAILTLGAGPETVGQKISPLGMLRGRTAANHYFQGVAPFIILSGGRVHPYKTIFTEALEMKKFLIDNLNVPADAIIIEPLARHTTTNYRNAIRLMFQYGFPKNKLAVTTSSSSHLDSVQKMENRLIKELGYMPYIPGRRVAETLLEFTPLDTAFAIDPDEPLDP